MLRDLNVDLPLEVYTDSEAAKGLACKKGLSSRTRHVAVHFLWVQEKIARGDFKLSKCWGGENPADLLTKHLSKDKINQFMHMLGVENAQGRAESAPALANDISSLAAAGPQALALAFIQPTRRW